MSVAKSNSENKKGVSLFKNGLKTEMLLVGILVILFIFFQRYFAGFFENRYIDEVAEAGIHLWNHCNRNGIRHYFFRN